MRQYLYEFASLRGENFRIMGFSPEDAWKNLVEREKDNGTLWRTSDPDMVTHCRNNGWEHLSCGPYSPGVAYKVIDEKVA